MLKDTAVEIYLAQPKGCAYGILAGANRYYDLGLSDQALELFVGFRGGMGCGSTCGCLTGAMGALSRKYAGREDLKTICGNFVPFFNEKSRVMFHLSVFIIMGNSERYKILSCIKRKVVI